MMDPHPLDRRAFLVAGAAAGLAKAVPASASPSPTTSGGFGSSFPAQPPELVKEIVSASHGRIEVVRDLLRESAELAKASWDWGFGDWESALGAASHVGNRKIAHLLMDHGARPNLFTFAMLGSLEVVKSMLAVQPQLAAAPGPHGISLIRHAQAGGKQSSKVVDYLQSLGTPPATSLPVSNEDLQSILGVYESTDGAKFRLEVFENRFGLAVKGGSGISRGFVRIAEDTFHAAGAEHMPFVFKKSGDRFVSASFRWEGRPVTVARVN